MKDGDSGLPHHADRPKTFLCSCDWMARGSGRSPDRIIHSLLPPHSSLRLDKFPLIYSISSPTKESLLRSKVRRERKNHMMQRGYSSLLRATGGVNQGIFPFLGDNHSKRMQFKTSYRIGLLSFKEIKPSDLMTGDNGFLNGTHRTFGLHIYLINN